MSRVPGAVLLACALLAACGPVDVVVASVPDGGFEPRGGPPCDQTADCPPDAFCEKPGCGAALGRCQRRPLLCDATPGPVCGCNGVTYWNDCIRRGSGEVMASAGECPTAASCTTASDCPDPAASCAHLYWSTAVCPASVPGSCWAVPPSCGAAAGAWTPCAGGACVDFCAAARSGTSHQRAPAPCQ